MAVPEAYKTRCDIGEKGCGKTTHELGDEKLKIESTVLKHCARHNMKVLFIDNWQGRPGYEKIKLITLEEIAAGKFKRGARRLIVEVDTTGDEKIDTRNQVAAYIYKYVRDTLIIVEDSKMIVPLNMAGTPWESLLISNKNIRCGLIFMYHSFMAIPKLMYQYIDELEIFKTKSHPRQRKNDIMNYEECLAIYERVINHPDPFYHQTFNNGS